MTEKEYENRIKTIMEFVKSCEDFYKKKADYCADVVLSLSPGRDGREITEWFNKSQCYREACDSFAFIYESLAVKVDDEVDNTDEDTDDE